MLRLLGPGNAFHPTNSIPRNLTSFQSDDDSPVRLDYPRSSLSLTRLPKLYSKMVQYGVRRLYECRFRPYLLVRFRVCLLACLSACLCASLSVYLSVCCVWWLHCLPVSLFAAVVCCLSDHLSELSSCLFTFTSRRFRFALFAGLLVCLSICARLYLPASLSACQCDRLSACLSVGMHACPSVCFFSCLSVWCCGLTA